VRRAKDHSCIWWGPGVYCKPWTNRRAGRRAFHQMAL
jgi:hypothetical protein